MCGSVEEPQNQSSYDSEGDDAWQCHTEDEYFQIYCDEAEVDDQ